MKRTAEIIAIGNEILSGNTVDTNSAWLAARLKSCAILISRKQVIADEKSDIIAALDLIRPETEFVFLSGGLGPTRDDRTKAVITHYFGGELVFREEIFTELSERYRIRGKAFLERNREQCVFPSNAEVIPNQIGTAPGMHFSAGDRQYFIMPGVPSEMKSMVDKHILPMICRSAEAEFMELNLRTTGIPESELTLLTEDIMADFQELDIGYYPGYHGVDIRLSAMGVNDRINELAGLLRKKLGDIIYSEGQADLIQVIAGLLRKRNLKLALAESCTGGLMAHRITKYPGASDFFLESTVVYSDKAKMDRLKVKDETLKKHGAVSRETVAEMLSGLQESSGADLCAAISGIAGPSGATPEKPLGTVWMGVLLNGNMTILEKHFSNDRIRNIHLSAQVLFNMIRLVLIDSPQMELLEKYWK